MPGMKAMLVGALLAACGTSKPATSADAPPASTDAPASMEDLDMQAADFECILRWDMVGGYRVTNKLGHDALAVAHSATGGTFPVGTIVQIVPTEAMVKRRAGFAAATNDWEFFLLGVAASGTTI